MKRLFQNVIGSSTAALLISGGLLVGLTGYAHGQTILEEQGTIEPAAREYPLEIEAGDIIAISLSSDEFDPVLTLIGPDGQEVATNDDFGRTLNSRIIFNAPVSGSYMILAKSLDGTGGNYSLEVRPATEYEVAYSEAQAQIQEQNFEGAIAAYTEAIELEPENPEPYLGRADAYFGQAQTELEAQGRVLEQPSDLAPEVRDAIVSDFEKAADLYEAAGDPFLAQSLREQVQYIETGEFPGPTGGGPRPE